MSILFAVKVFGDLCLYFAVACAIGGVCGQTMTPLWPGLVCALCAGLACLLQGKRLRLLPLALLGLCFLFPKTTPDWFILLPPVAYTAWLALGRRFDLDHGDYQEFFPRGLAALGVAFLFSLLGLDLGQLAAYGTGYLLCGVYLLRQLRLDTGKDWRDKLLNLLVLLAVLAAGYLSTLFVRGFAYLAGQLLRTLEWFFLLLEALFEWLTSQEPPASAAPEKGETRYPPLNLPPFEWEAVEAAETSPITPIIITILVLTALAAGGWLLVRRMLRSVRTGSVSAGRQSWTERMEAPARARRSFHATDRDRVRQCYQKFLQLLHSRGASLSRSHTSSQIHLAAIPLTDPEPASRLRDLYRRARYDEAALISPEDARQAKSLLQQLQKSSKESR